MSTQHITLDGAQQILDKLCDIRATGIFESSFAYRTRVPSLINRLESAVKTAKSINTFVGNNIVKVCIFDEVLDDVSDVFEEYSILTKGA